MKSFITTAVLLACISMSLAAVINVPGDSTTIQAGINGAVTGDTVLVASGTYYENLNYNGKDIVLTSVAGPEHTIIDGSSNGAVVLIVSGESNAAVLDGFTIQHGSGSPSLNDPDKKFGGGICLRYDSSPRLSNLIVTNNKALGFEASGGGIGVSLGSEPIIENVIISHNESYHGGGLYSYFAAPILKNMKIHDNYASSGGGGAGFHNSTPKINNISVYDNYADDYAGGLWFYDKSMAVLNALTIYGNTSRISGGGIWTLGNNSIYLINSICRGNAPNQITSFVSSVYQPGVIGIAYSDIEGGELGLSLASGELTLWEDNIDIDAEFTNVDLRDFTLSPGSPCIDAGIGSYVVGPEVLIELSPDEYAGTAPDMGACESTHESSGIKLTDPRPYEIVLHQNYPNPFNPSTQITYSLKNPSPVRLDIFTIRGKHVTTLVDNIEPIGVHKQVWDGSDYKGLQVESGIYIYRLTASDEIQTRTMLLIR